MKNIYAQLLCLALIFFVVPTEAQEINYLVDLGSDEYLIEQVGDIKKYKNNWEKNDIKEYVMEYFICGEFGCQKKNRVEIVDKKIANFCIFDNGKCIKADKKDALTMDDFLSVSSNDKKKCEFKYNKTLELLISYSCSYGSESRLSDHLSINFIKVSLFGVQDKNYTNAINPVDHSCIYGKWAGSIKRQGEVKFSFGKNKKYKIINLKDEEVVSSGSFSIDTKVYPYKIHFKSKKEGSLFGLYKCLGFDSMNMKVVDGPSWPDDLNRNSVGFGEYKKL